MKWQTLTQMMAEQAERNPDSLFVRFVDFDLPPVSFTYKQLWIWAIRWATLLTSRGLSEQQPVILSLPNRPDFVGAYFGTLLAGGIPAPIAPVRRLVDDDLYLHIVAKRLRQLDTNFLVVPEEQSALGNIEPISEVDGLQLVTARNMPGADSFMAERREAQEIAHLQFTSGTIGKQKVVQLSHSALLTQAHAISQALDLNCAEDWAVSWLPLFHDMGLIGFLLTPAYVAGHVTILPTEKFIRTPSTWIRALSEFRASITGGPPSAYSLAARSTRGSNIGTMDLSRIRIAIVGAEPITPDSLGAFVDRFEQAGFSRTSLMPTYGLAENGLAVTMPELNEEPYFDVVQAQMMQKEGFAQPVEEANQKDGRNHPGLTLDEISSLSGRKIACVGIPLVDTDVIIVDSDGKPFGDRYIGQILVKSQSIMKNYRDQPEETASVLRDGWLRTGDLGYMVDGHIFVTGREKEVLIIGGRNYHPDELEHVANKIRGVRRGRSVAIACPNPTRGTEEAVILVETRLRDKELRDDLRQHIRQALQQAGYPVGQIILLPPKTIKWTASGKLKRLDCKNRYLAGEYSDYL